MDGAPDGGTDVILRSQIGGFWLAALGLLAALALPLSSETVAPTTARSGLLAAVIAAACLFALAPRWPVLSAAFGGLGVMLGCFVTLMLLSDNGIAGYATWGFWLLTLAIWTGRARSFDGSWKPGPTTLLTEMSSPACCSVASG